MSVNVDRSPLPSRLAVRELVGDLIGRDLEIGDAEPIANDPTNVIAVYTTDGNIPTAVSVTTLAGACWIGSALGMLPKGGAEDAIKEGVLPEMMGDCCYEVLNVLSAVFNVPEAPHVRLFAMYRPGDDIPNDVMAMTQILGSRLDISMDIAGYGVAPLSVVVR